MDTRQFEPIVEMKNVGLAYGNNAPVLHDIDFAFRRGSMHFLTGKSGAGKTSATFGAEIPVSADGQTISAKILPKNTPSGLIVCSSFADAVSNYASLYGTFDYSANAGVCIKSNFLIFYTDLLFFNAGTI
jgi:ABC-type dipeptide/oligopeptide/nickel transport system ATPase component